jgi:hypothetical protein
MSTDTRQRTSFGDLGKGQASASLEIDIIGIDKGTQGSQGFSGEEIGFSALSKRSQGLWLATFVGWRGFTVGHHHHRSGGDGIWTPRDRDEL